MRDETLMTVKEVAEAYDISVWAIYQNIRRYPEFPVVNVGPKKSYRIRRDDFEDWLGQRTYNSGRGKLLIPMLDDVLEINKLLPVAEWEDW